MTSIVVRFAYNGPEVGVLVHAGPKTYSVANLYGIDIKSRAIDVASGRSSYHERWSRDQNTIVIWGSSKRMLRQMIAGGDIKLVA